MALSDEQLMGILTRAAEDFLSAADRHSTSFFNFETRPNVPYPMVRMHRWAIVYVSPSDTIADIVSSLNVAVVDLIGSSFELIGELVFGSPRLAPAPVWIDGLPLFAQSSADGNHRFGVEGGNTIESVGCIASDIENAIDRLTHLDPDQTFDSDEQLTIYCSSATTPELMRASSAVRQKCRVVELSGFQDETSWVMSRSQVPCGLDICSPEIPTNNDGSRVELGVQYVIWVIDPRCVVKVGPTKK